MTATLEVVGALEDSSQIALVLPVVERLCADARMAMNELRRRSHGGGGLSELFAGELADVEEDLLRDLLLQQVLSIVMVLEAPEVAPWTGREKALKVADRWVDEFALRGVVAAESREMHLALLGLCRMLKLGQDETLAAIASVSPPDATAVLDGPPADDETLLRWLRTSRLFHGLLLGTFVDQTRAELDLGRWRECHGMFVAACELATQRGADDRMSPLLAALSTVIDPLLGGDVAALERGVAAAIARDDRNLFEALMEFVAATSRFVNEERWRSFVGVWAKVATRRNAWFPLAWRVARIGSGEHAVAVAEAAVMKFPKDAEMAAELVSLREFVGKAKSR